jgi:hypothetical protein
MVYFRSSFLLMGSSCQHGIHQVHKCSPILIAKKRFGQEQGDAMRNAKQRNNHGTKLNTALLMFQVICLSKREVFFYQDHMKEHTFFYRKKKNQIQNPGLDTTP